MLSKSAGSTSPAIARGLRRGGAHEGRQSVEAGVAQLELEAGLVGQHVLREARRELREAFHDLRVARLLVGAELRAGADEVDMQPLDQSQRLRVEPEFVAPRVHRVHAREQAGVHRHRAVVRRQRAGKLALHGLDVGRGVRRGERVERRLDARQQPPAAIERGHGVVEGRRVGLRGNGLDLDALRLHRGVERGREIGGADLRERGQRERRRPVAEQRIVDSHGVCFWVSFWVRLCVLKRIPTFACCRATAKPAMMPGVGVTDIGKDTGRSHPPLT